MPTWPTALPDPLETNYALEPVDQTIRTDMELGAARVRRRTSARDDRITLSWVMTDAEYVVFRGWYADDAAGISGGAAWFDISLAVGDGGLTAVQARFVGTPKAQALGGLNWMVTATLEIRWSYTNGSPQAAGYVRFPFTEGAGDYIACDGNTSLFPTLHLGGQTTSVWSVADHLSIAVGGNPTDRVFGNAAIDGMMRLDNLTGYYRCKFAAFKLWRFVNTTAISTGVNERLFQYGDQGSSSSAPDGGWVARINSASSGVFLKGSISLAIHTPDNGTVKPGTQDDDTFPDPIYTTRVFSNSELEAGISLLFGVDNSVSPYRAIVYVNGVLEGFDAQPDLAWVLPGISDNGPGNDGTSNGLVLFAQSTNQGVQPLKSARVSPVFFGQAADTAHLAEIAARLHADPYRASPYA